MAEAKTKSGKVEQKDRRKRAGVVVRHPTFDLDAYMSRYAGYTRVFRYLFIANRCPDLRVRAYRGAILEIKNSLNTQLFMDTVSSAREIIGDELSPECELDDDWMKRTNRLFTEKLARMEQDLNVKIRESKTDLIREGYLAVANHLMLRGDFAQALTKFLETKEYSTKREHTLMACLLAIKASILSGSMGHVKSQADRAQGMSHELNKDPVAAGKVSASLGLFELKRAAYRSAADFFLSTKHEMEGQYSEIMAGEDVALYGTLCALATFTRRDLKSRVLDNEMFRKYMELVPGLVRMVETYYTCQFGECFQLLGAMENDILLDYYAAAHYHRLNKMMREKAIQMYFSPFVAVRISNMARAFNVDPTILERELVTLIAENKIKGRIDSQNKVLHAKNADQRVVTFQRSLSLGASFVRDARSMLLRMSLIKNDIVVKHPQHRMRESGLDDLPLA